MPCLFFFFFSYSDFFILLPFTCIFIFSSIRVVMTSILIYHSSFLRSSFLMPLSSSCFLFGLYTSSFFSSFSFVFFSFFLRCLIRVLSSLFYHCSSLTRSLSIRPLFKRCLGRCSAATQLLSAIGCHHSAIVRPLFSHHLAAVRPIAATRPLFSRCLAAAFWPLLIQGNTSRWPQMIHGHMGINAEKGEGRGG